MVGVKTIYEKITQEGAKLRPAGGGGSRTRQRNASYGRPLRRVNLWMMAPRTVARMVRKTVILQ